MSVRTNGAGDQLTRNTSLGLSTGSFILAFWVKLISDRDTFQGMVGFAADATDSADSILAGTNGTGTVTTGFSTGGGHSGTVATVVSTWYWVVMDRLGGDWEIRVFDDTTSTTPFGTTGSQSNSDDFSACDWLIIGQKETNEWPDAEFANVKVIIGNTTNWSNAECRTESQLFEVQSAEGGTTWGSWRLENTDADTDGINDNSGNGRHLTNTGCVNGASRPDQLETAGATAAVTGTATASITEADIVTGGKTIVITLTGDTWVV